MYCVLFSFFVFIVSVLLREFNVQKQSATKFFGAVQKLSICRAVHFHHFLEQKEFFSTQNGIRRWHKKEGVLPKKWCPLHKFFHVFFLVIQSFLLGFSWSSDNITDNNKENISKTLSVNLRCNINYLLPPMI